MSTPTTTPVITESSQAASNVEQRPPVDANTATATDGASVLPISPVAQGQRADEQFESASQSHSVHGNPATPSMGGDAMDLDGHFFSLNTPSTSPDDVNLSRRLDQLKVSLDIVLAEVELLAHMMVAERNNQVRVETVARLGQLQQSANVLINLRSNLLQSMAAVPSAPVVAPVIQAQQPATLPIWPVLLPYFQWVGVEKFAPEHTLFPTIDDCLRKFEDVMHGHRMVFDAEFQRLVPPMLSSEQRTWYASLMSSSRAPSTWEAFKAAVKERYGESLLVEQRRCATDIINGQFKPNESLLDFIDRFNELRRGAKDQVPPDFLVLAGFLKALPPVLKDKVNTIRQSRKLMNSADVAIAMDIAREAIQGMSMEEVNAVMATVAGVAEPGVVRTAAGTSASQWAAYASSASSTSASRSPATAAGRITKQAPKSAKKSCKFHQGTPHNHATEECKLFRKLVDEHQPSANGTPVAPKNRGRFMMSLADAKAQNRCRICGAHNYSDGHDCNTAIRTGNPPTSTLHKFGMLRISDAEPSSATSGASLAAVVAKSCILHPASTTHDSSECQELLRLRTKKQRARGSAATVKRSGTTSSSVGVPPASTEPALSVANGQHGPTAPLSASEPMDVDTHTAVHAQECKDNHKSSLPVHKSNSLLIPLVVESHKVYGVLDTGCTFSICSPRFAQQLGVQINPVLKGHVQLGHIDSVQPRVGTCSLQISYNKRSFIHTFEIFNFFTDSDRCPMLLGLDIMPALQIGVTGLASTWFEEIGPRLPDPVDPDIEPNNDPYGSPDERAEAFKPIEQLLEENAAIDLSTTHCNLPGAIVQLETIPGKIAYRAPYPIPVVYKDAVAKQLKEWERDGVIERSPSHNGWNSPLLVVAKKNSAGEYSFDKPRIVADVRLLNQMLISTDKYIMPRIDEIHARHSRAVITSSIDIKSFFTSFLVDPRHRHKLAFTDPFTQTQWVHRKVCFGVNFMGNLSMRLISNLFADMLDHVSLYIDDLGCLTYTDSLDEHVALVSEVIRRLTTANLQINRDKFVFAQRSTHVLGWSIVQNRLVPDARKLTNFHLWPIPTTGKQVMKYLGFCNYFRNVIPRFSELAAPLDALRNYKSLDGLWTDVHTKAFKALQTALSSPVALSPVDFDYKLHVATDASATAIGGIIYYIKQGIVHYVVMASRKLSPSEMAYSTTKRELLAIVYMFTKYHKWLFGIEFVLHTDHRSLIWLQTQTTPNMMLLTWYEKLFFDYKYELVHIPGTRNLLPDALSRLYTTDDDALAHKLDGGNRYNNQNIMVPEKKRKSKPKNGAGLISSNELQATQSPLAKLGQTNRMKFKRKQRFNNKKQFQPSFGVPLASNPEYFSKESNDSEVDIFNAETYNMPTVSAQDLKNQQAINVIGSDTIDPSDDPPSLDQTALVSRAMQFADYMTPPKKDRLELIMRVHLLGHVGMNSIEKILHKDYKVHWINMRKDIAKVTKDCFACQSHGIYQVGYHPPRSVLPDNVFDHIAIDLGDFSTTSTSGNNYLLVIVDYFSRFTILRALPDKSPVTVARSLLSVCCLFGFPKRLTSDNGSEFVGAFMREFSQLSGIDKLTSLPYAAQANGVVEAYVGISKRSIIKSLTHDAQDPEAWDEYLDVIQYAMNIQYARLHQSQPFAIMFGRAPNLFQDYTQLPNVDHAPEDPTKEVIDARLQKIKDVVIPAIHKRIQEQQLRDHERFEKHHKIIEEKYPIGSKVMLLDPVKSTKMNPRWLGPYFIKNYTRNGSYTLADITGDVLSRDVATQMIRVVDFSDNHVTKGLLPLHYEVQAIVNHRVERKTGRMKFLVNWVGYPDPKDNTWQYESDFDSKRPIRDYWARINPDHKNPFCPLPKTVNKRKINQRRQHAGPAVQQRYPSIPNSRLHNPQQ